MTTESFRKDVAKKLSDLQKNDDDTANVSFPKDLTSTDRKYIHKIAESFKLHSMSEGIGEDRYIRVYKVPPAGQEGKFPKGGSTFTPNLTLEPPVAQQLREIAARAPPSSGRAVLANVKPLSSKHRLQVVKLSPGDAVEGYWPDDDEWLAATVSEEHDDGSFRIVWEADASESDVPANYVRRLDDVGLAGVEMSVETMDEALEKRRSLPKYAKLGLKREDLPAFKQRVEVVEKVRDNQVVLLSGETGCGKSTQVPQIILDASPNAKILVMQPRKIAAVTLAERIAAERCQLVGQEVGYQVPFDTKGYKSKLIFATLGVFRKRMLTDPDLAGITHVVFDEVHERDRLADFNMISSRSVKTPHRSKSCADECHAATGNLRGVLFGCGKTCYSRARFPSKSAVPG